MKYERPERDTSDSMVYNVATEPYPGDSLVLTLVYALRVEVAP